MNTLWIPPCLFGKRQTNLTASDRDGTNITTSGTAHVKGAYSAGELIATADEDTYALTISVTGVGLTGTATSYLLDIGVGASGSERDLIQNLDCWGAGPSSGAGHGAKRWTFPVFIPKGERLAARGQALAVSDVAAVAVWLHGAAAGWGMEVPSLWEQLGTITTSNGPSVTPASGAFGSWTTILDPITKDYRWWHVGYGALSDITLTTGGIAMIELGIGDTSAAVTTIGTWTFGIDTTEMISGPTPTVPVFYPVNADTTNGVFARIASYETEARSVVAYAAE